MKCIYSIGVIWVVYELVDVVALGFFGIVIGRGLKCSEDGREEGRGRGRDFFVIFFKVGKNEKDFVKKWCFFRFLSGCKVLILS